MRFLLLNDTSNNSHYGCHAVSNGLRAYLARRDDAVVEPVFNRQLRYVPETGELEPQQRRWFEARIAASDYVILNGEGTLHKSRAPELELALAAVAEAGKPFCVANSILRDYTILAEALGGADFITLRDDRSVTEAGRLGLTATRCADAALFARFDDWCGIPRSASLATTDWHGEAPGQTKAAIVAGLRRGAVFIPFLHPLAWADWPGIVARLARFRRVICGRYHGALFAILSGADVRFLPSNSDKIEELARELGLEPSLDLEVDADLSESSARLASAQAALLRMRQDSTAHPLHPMELRLRLYASATPTAAIGARTEGFAGRAASSLEMARGLADALKATPLALPRRQRLAIEAQLVAEKLQVLRMAAAFLLQEGADSAIPRVLGALRKQGETAEAYALALKLTEQAPGAPGPRALLGDLALDVERPEVALAYFELAEIDEQLVSWHNLRAARAAGRLHDPVHQLDRLRRALSEPDVVPPAGVLLEAAVAASRQRRGVEAIDLARRALAAEPALAGWPLMQAGIVLASHGAAHEGHSAMARALVEMEPRARIEAARQGEHLAGAADRWVYVPTSIGIGSAMLAAATVADGTVSRLEVEPRLHPAFRRSFPDLEVLSPKAAAGDEGCRDSLFVRFARALPRLPYDLGGPLIHADPHQAEIIDRRYARELGDRPRVGIAWSTINARTGRDRNLPLSDLRYLLGAHPDHVFISLQAHLRNAERDFRIVGQSNLFVDPEIDPIATVEGQFAQIATLDHVVTIDCSAAHFAGALGVPTQVLLTGYPTWQWPEDLSFYASARTLRSVAQLDLTDQGPARVTR